MDHRYLSAAAAWLSLAPIILGEGISNRAFAGQVEKIFYHHDGNPSRLPSKNIGNEIIYQIFIDRFANGNAKNDCLYDSRFCARGEYEDWYRYQGGDLRGIIDQLDYLKTLGVTRLWLTPIFDNQQVTVQRQKFGREVEVTSYHGYWVRDWFRLNPFFTDLGSSDYAIVDELIRKAAPEMKIYLDTVFNHSNPSDATSWSLDYLDNTQPLGGEGRSHLGAYFKNGSYLASLPEDQWRASTVPGYQKLFHHNPAIGAGDWDDDYRVKNYMLDGLTDFDQTNQKLQDYLFEAHEFWLDRFPGLGGFRIDTIKHVPHWFWKKFSEQFYRKNPQMEAFGEYYNGGPSHPGAQQFYLESRMSMIDFEFRNILEEVFLNNQSFGKVSSFWQDEDPKLIDARGLITFLDSHDLARFRGAGLSAKRMYQMAVLWLVSRGVPCIYYGLEQDLFHPGDPGDPFNRPQMKSFDREFNLFRAIRKLIELRKANLALRYGATHVVHESRDIFSFERFHNQQVVFFATSKNPRAGSDDFTIHGLRLPTGSYTDLLSGTVYKVEKGQVNVSLADGDVILLAYNSGPK